MRGQMRPLVAGVLETARTIPSQCSPTNRLACGIVNLILDQDIMCYAETAIKRCAPRIVAKEAEISIGVRPRNAHIQIMQA